MARSNTPRVDEGVPIPSGGALGLLALGYRGLEAWRLERGTEWIEQRRLEWEAGRDREAEQKRRGEKAASEPGDPG